MQQILLRSKHSTVASNSPPSARRLLSNAVNNKGKPSETKVPAPQHVILSLRGGCIAHAIVDWSSRINNAEQKVRAGFQESLPHHPSVMSLKYGTLFSGAGVFLPNQGGYDDADCENNYSDS